MTIHLFPEHEAFIREKVESGEYDAADDVITTALDCFQQIEQLRALRLFRRLKASSICQRRRSSAMTSRAAMASPGSHQHQIVGGLELLGVRSIVLASRRPDPVPSGAPRGIFEQIGVSVPPL